MEKLVREFRLADGRITKTLSLFSKAVVKFTVAPLAWLNNIFPGTVAAFILAEKLIFNAGKSETNLKGCCVLPFIEAAIAANVRGGMTGGGWVFSFFLQENKNSAMQHK